jgi:hypothetical protein
MRAGWMRAAAVAVALAAAWPLRATLGDDDVVEGVTPRPAPLQPVVIPGVVVQGAARPPGIDLAAHVDINVVLPPHHWRVAGGLNNIVIAGGGRLVVNGNLTIGGEIVADPAERIRKADEAVLVKLRQTQRDRLAAVAADPGLTAAERRTVELASEADIRRVLLDVARLRKQYAGRRANLGDPDWQAFQKDVTVCRQAIDEAFGADSLVAAVRAGFADAAGR